MSLKRIHEETEKNWGQFYTFIDEFSDDPETFRVIYTRNPDHTYTAQMPEAFGYLCGKGLTRDEAREQLINKIKNVLE